MFDKMDGGRRCLMGWVGIEDIEDVYVLEEVNRVYVINRVHEVYGVDEVDVKCGVMV